MKKLISLFTIFTLLLTVAACGGKSDEPDVEPTPEPIPLPENYVNDNITVLNEREEWVIRNSIVDDSGEETTAEYYYILHNEEGTVVYIASNGLTKCEDAYWSKFNVAETVEDAINIWLESYDLYLPDMSGNNQDIVHVNGRYEYQETVGDYTVAYTVDWKSNRLRDISVYTEHVSNIIIFPTIEWFYNEGPGRYLLEDS